jgi:hypothetical protein
MSMPERRLGSRREASTVRDISPWFVDMLIVNYSDIDGVEPSDQKGEPSETQ